MIKLKDIILGIPQINEGLYPKYNAKKVQQTRYKASDVWTNDPTINEIGDLSQQPYYWKYASSESDDKNKVFRFETKEGVKYEVNLYYTGSFDDKESWVLEFLAKAPGLGGYSSKSLTGGGEPLKIMSTVVDITKDFIKTNGNVGRIVYTPTEGKTGERDAKDNIRGKLYRAIIQKSFPNAQLSGTDSKAVVVDLSAYSSQELNEIKYTNPNFDAEWEEAERYPEFVKMGKEAWLKLAKQGKLISYSSIKDVLGNVNLNFDNLEEPKKQRFISAFKKGNIETPIAVKFPDNDYDLVAGNTRLSGLVKNGIDPKIWVVDLSKQPINESWHPNKARIINRFIDYATNYLSIDRPTIKLINTPDYTQYNHSFGGYMPSEKKLLVVVHNRNIADILRTLAHELVHHMQNLDNRLQPDSGMDGSPEENEANSLAAVIMRKFGRENPEIYE